MVGLGLRPALGTRNFENRTLFHGDNLPFLRGLNSATVNLIATDPPFNKSKDFHATPDSLAAGATFHDRWSWRRDIHDDWVLSIMRDQPEVWQVIQTAKDVYGNDMGAFLCWLGVRLLEMHRILTDDGSIYLHIDHTAHAWVKCLMDAIFGKANFRNEIIWAYRGMPSAARRWQQKHDTLLFYTKSDDYTFNVLRSPPTAGSLRTFASARKRGYNLNRSKKMVTVFDWKKYRAAVDKGTIPSDLQPKEFTGGQPPMRDWWEDIRILGGPENKERVGYPTQKPLALYERIIKASSNPGDMVLDPFAGCATTCVAAEQLGRQWVGMDIWKGSHKQVLDRLEKEGLAIRGRSTGHGQQALRRGDIKRTTKPPERTDSGETAALILQTPMGKQEKRYPRPRTQHGTLLVDLGPFCQGCGANYDFDRRVLEVDHIRPKSDDGTDAYENLTLLCPPCNKEKRDYYTLSYLQDYNRKNGYMKNESVLRMGRAARRARRRRR